MKILLSILLLTFSSFFTSISLAEEKVPEQRDFSQFEETSEYEETPRNASTLKRWWIYKHSELHILVPYPEDLDKRREAILDAIWNDDEAAFTELAKSPSTGEGGLANQKFSKIVSELQKMDRWPLRTMRSLPTLFSNPKPADHIYAFHQIMTLPATNKTPRRGNLNLIFNKADWSLAFVRVNWFDSDKVNLLPQPNSAISDDPVIDRGVPGKKTKSYRAE